MELDEFKSKVVPLRAKLHSFARSILANEADAEDAVQEVFLRLWGIRGQLVNHPNIGGYAFQMLKNICIDKIRRRKIYISPDDLADTENKHTPYQFAEQNDGVRLVKRLIELLPELQRRIITMRDVEGYELKEIADITGSEVSAVTVNLSRARRKVREGLIQSGWT